MSIERIFLIGAGDHAMVVLNALESAEKRSDRIRIFDESARRIGQKTHPAATIVPSAAIGATLAGYVGVGEGVLIGADASVLPIICYHCSWRRRDGQCATRGHPCGRVRRQIR
jgi:hypothetical protein